MRPLGAGACAAGEGAGEEEEAAAKARAEICAFPCAEEGVARGRAEAFLKREEEPVLPGVAGWESCRPVL